MTLIEIETFLRRQNLTLHVEYSGEHSVWIARLRKIDWECESGVLSTSAPAETLEAAVTRVIEMWRGRHTRGE